MTDGLNLLLVAGSLLRVHHVDLLGLHDALLAGFDALHVEEKLGQSEHTLTLPFSSLLTEFFVLIVIFVLEELTALNSTLFEALFGETGHVLMDDLVRFDEVLEAQEAIGIRRGWAEVNGFNGHQVDFFDAGSNLGKELLHLSLLLHLDQLGELLHLFSLLEPEVHDSSVEVSQVEVELIEDSIGSLSGLDCLDNVHLLLAGVRLNVSKHLSHVKVALKLELESRDHSISSLSDLSFVDTSSDFHVQLLEVFGLLHVVFHDVLHGGLVVLDRDLNPVASLLSPLSNDGLVFLLTLDEELKIILMVFSSESLKFFLVKLYTP